MKTNIDSATGAPLYDTGLMLCHQGVRYGVIFDRNDAHDGRPCFLWSIDVWEGGTDGQWATLAHGDDLRLGAADEAVEGKALASLFRFLGAFAEALEYGDGNTSENCDLFPEPVRTVARGTADEYALLASSVWPENR